MTFVLMDIIRMVIMVTENISGTDDNDLYSFLSQYIVAWWTMNYLNNEMM